MKLENGALHNFVLTHLRNENQSPKAERFVIVKGNVRQLRLILHLIVNISFNLNFPIIIIKK